jgi:hypothetical protein
MSERRPRPRSPECAPDRRVSARLSRALRIVWPHDRLCYGSAVSRPTVYSYIALPRANIRFCRIHGDLRTGGGHGCGQWGTAAARANGGSGRARRRAGRAVPDPAGWCGGGAGVARDFRNICGRGWSRSSGCRATADRLAAIGKSSLMLAARARRGRSAACRAAFQAVGHGISHFVLPG